jgi:hypothetical protein
MMGFGVDGRDSNPGRNENFRSYRTLLFPTIIIKTAVL